MICSPQKPLKCLAQEMQETVKTTTKLLKLHHHKTTVLHSLQQQKKTFFKTRFGIIQGWDETEYSGMSAIIWPTVPAPDDG
jgi:hypothetical protein